MHKLFNFGLIIISFVYMIYLVLPNPSFPTPPPDSLQSKESADTESPLRRAYFTNFSRSEVLNYYQNEFKGFRLNYPPEEAYGIIRDQTRSTFLQEIVHPMRESFFVNGFEPKNAKDAIYIEGKFWKQKITVKYVSSNILARLLVGFLSIGAIYIVKKSIQMETKK